VSLGRHGKILMQTDFSGSKEHIRQHYPDVEHDFDPVIFGKRSPVLTIGDGTSIGDSFFISCANRIEIGRHVLFSDRVFISDSNHLYDNPDLPIALQANDLGSPIIIEDHCWIGINVVILQGVRIGKHSIVSAASVVTQDVPPFSVVAGNPARVVRSIAPQKGGAATAPAAESRSPSSPATELARSAAAYVSRELGRTVTPDDKLLRSGLLDSLATLRLFTFLEEKHGVRIDEPRFVQEHPETLNDLCRLVR
jgi:acetyltransferase-like isoleucine patch superfamily enzyme/acyl carrier protein